MKRSLFTKSVLKIDNLDLIQFEYINKNVDTYALSILDYRNFNHIVSNDLLQPRPKIIDNILRQSKYII